MSYTDLQDLIQQAVLIWHPNGQQVALTHQTLPAVSVAPAGDLIKAVQENWSINALLLHDGGFVFGQQGTPQLITFEESLPEGFSWGRWSVPSIADARPWQKVGWPRQIHQIFKQANLSVQGSIKQISSTDLATVLQVKTDRGEVYLKMRDSEREVQVTEYISKALPKLSVQQLAVDKHRYWQITAAAGQCLEYTGQIDLWTTAIQQLGAFQQQADASALANLGCQVYPLEQMCERIDEFLSDTTVLQDWGLNAQQIQTLQEARIVIRKNFHLVSELGLPDLPAHGDAHPRNTLYGEQGVVWFDWDQVCSTAHPFMDAGWFLGSALLSYRQEWPIFQDNSNAIDQLFEAFLKTMHCVGARKMLNAAIPLAFLHRSVIYDQNFRHWKGTVPGVRPQYVNFYLRRAIYEIDRLNR